MNDVVTKDDSQYSLVQPVLRPANMTIKEGEHELAMASKQFFLF